MHLRSSRDCFCNLEMVKVNQVNKNPAMALRTFVRNRDNFRYFVVPLVLLVLRLIFTGRLGLEHAQRHGFN